jgi:H-NS histone C-terminal domain
VSQWEYRKIALNQLPRKGDDIDLLCEVGMEGWELVAILANSMAYLKRQATRDRNEASDRKSVSVPAGFVNGNHTITGSAVKPKYRDPKTGETWSGRGRMATWLKSKQDAGANIDDYLV